MKTRVTITLSAPLLARVDGDARARAGSSRSAVIEEVLQRHYLDAIASRVAAQTADYYASRSAADEREDLAIVGASSRSAARAVGRSTGGRKRG